MEYNCYLIVSVQHYMKKKSCQPSTTSFMASEVHVDEFLPSNINRLQFRQGELEGSTSIILFSGHRTLSIVLNYSWLTFLIIPAGEDESSRSTWSRGLFLL